MNKKKLSRALTVISGNIVFQSICSLLLSKIVISWYLLSTFFEENTFTYTSLFNNSGYLLAIAIVLWTSNWRKETIASLIRNRSNTNEFSISKFYTLKTLLYVFIVSNLCLYLLIFLYYSFNEYNRIVNILIISFQDLVSLYNNHFFIVLIFIIILFSKKISSLTHKLVDLIFILSIGNIWRFYTSEYNIEDFVKYNIDLVDVNQILIYISLFLCAKFFLVVWQFNIANNNLSNWYANKLSLSDYLQLIRISQMYILLFFFFSVFTL